MSACFYARQAWINDLSWLPQTREPNQVAVMEKETKTESKIETKLDETRRRSTEQPSAQTAESSQTESQCSNGVCPVLWKPQRTAA